MHGGIVLVRQERYKYNYWHKIRGMLLSKISLQAYNTAFKFPFIATQLSRPGKTDPEQKETKECGLECLHVSKHIVRFSIFSEDFLHSISSPSSVSTGCRANALSKEIV